jgi:hypothetical protein
MTTRSPYLDWLSRVVRPKADGADCEATAGGDLVLGYATGYGVEHIEAFVRSLRAFYDGPAALVVDPAPAVLAFLAAQRIEAVFPQDPGGWTPQPVVRRFAAYAEIIAGRLGPGAVFLTDVRDVVFQASPFETPVSRLEVFVESETVAMADHAFQIKHLRALVGGPLAQGLEDRRCICAGTIAGPASDVLRLCRLILWLGAIPRSAIGGGFGVDQASLAVAVRYGLIDAQVEDNYRRVATLGRALDGIRVENGRIVNADGTVSPVVHQYDRHPELMALVRTRWSHETPDRVKTGEQGARRAWSKTLHSLARRTPEPR